MNHIREGIIQIKQLMELARKGKRRFWLDGDLIHTTKGNVFVPRWGDLRKEIMRECPDSLCAGYPGARRTMALVERAYYWPRMFDDVKLYVKTCLVYQQNKTEKQRPAGLLDPLPIP